MTPDRYYAVSFVEVEASPLFLASYIAWSALARSSCPLFDPSTDNAMPILTPMLILVPSTLKGVESARRHEMREGFGTISVSDAARDDRKLLPLVGPRHQMARTAQFDATRCGLQQLVTEGMTEGIIRRLEAVEIKKNTA